MAAAARSGAHRHGTVFAPRPSLESLAVQLSLDREEAHDLLFDLMSRELVVPVERLEEDDVPQFRLSDRGWAAAGAYVERAGRFLPGWPPPAPFHRAFLDR